MMPGILEFESWQDNGVERDVNIYKYGVSATPEFTNGHFTIKMKIMPSILEFETRKANRIKRDVKIYN